MGQESERKGLKIHGKELGPGEIRRLTAKKLSIPGLPAWKREFYGFIREWYSPSDIVIQSSSGTTGSPKLIELPKEAMRRSAQNTLHALQLNKNDSALLVLPVRYIAGKMMVVRAIEGGLDLHIAEPRAHPGLKDVTDITFSAMVPMQVFNLLEGGDFPGITKLIIGGSEISDSLIDRISGLRTEVYATFGMAETASHIALRRLNGSQAEKVYRILPGTEVRTDERGCLVIRTDFLEEEIVTNDLVRLEGPGAFNWIGRYDNLLNSGGVKVIPEEIEGIVYKTTGRHIFLAGLPDNRLGQRLVLAVEGGLEGDDEPRIREALARILPSFLVPSGILTIGSFPRNESFKVDRIKLQKMIADSIT